MLLPARLPVLLLNGSSGIAVGMATEIPSHNLTEVGEAAIEVIRNPEITTDELLEIVKGPDFPGGAQVISSASDIKNVYQSGYGNLQVRATYHFEELSRGQWQLVFDSVPYKVSVMKVMSELEALTNPKAPQGKKSLTAKQQQDKQLIMNVMSGMETSRVPRHLFAWSSIRNRNPLIEKNLSARFSARQVLKLPASSIL